MQFLLDSTTATLLVGALILMLATLTLRQNEEAGDISSRRAIAGRTAALEMHVASDFQNVMAVQARTDTSVTFALVSDPATMATTTVTYGHSRRVAGGDTLYDVRRHEGAGATLLGAGLADWAVGLRDSTGASTTVPSNARELTVRFASTPAFPADGDTLDVVWERTFAPSLLRGFHF